MRYLLVYLLWMYAVNMNITQYFYTETKIIKNVLHFNPFSLLVDCFTFWIQ